MTSLSQHGLSLRVAAVWIFFSAWCVLGGYALSLCGLLNRPANALLLALGLVMSFWLFWKLSGNSWSISGLRWRRFRNPFALIYFICAALALTGGLLHAPTNYDAFCYRIPRMLHWLDAGRCQWIGGYNDRMDFSSHGFEWLMLPGFAAFHTLRLAFLINGMSYILMPGLVFSAYRSLGIRRSVAATWMWIIPCGSCFAMEAGSIGNDFIAVIYILAAITFAMRARVAGDMLMVWIALLATGLVTCAKASNLPLLLPVAICMAPLYLRWPRLILPSVGACVVALAVSYAPLAALNLKHTGDWTGSPVNNSKASNPVAGAFGNTLQLAISSFTPAIFPYSPQWNAWTEKMISRPPLASIHDSFKDLNLGIREMASEEGGGLGLGVTASVMLAFAGACVCSRFRDIPKLGACVSLGFWVALLVFMCKLANPSGPRLLACYYPGLLVLPLLLKGQRRIVHGRWWRVAALALILPIVPALVFNPSRPIVRLDRLSDLGLGRLLSNQLVERWRTVYGVYESRSDAHLAVRCLLPSEAKVIGFGGTSDESEYSFWLPLGERIVRDFTPVSGGNPPDPAGMDAIVTSDWGCNDRFHMTPAQLAERLGWRVAGSVSVQTMASTSAREWSVLLPPAPSR